MRTMKKRDIRTYTMVGMTLLTPIVIYAADLIQFQPHTLIKSAEVNQNFAQLDSRIATYEDAITVDGNGNVGIGTTAPDYPLDVNGNIQTSAGVIGHTLWISNGPDGGIRKHAASGNILNFRNSGGTIEATINEVGNVGIGTTTPNYKLEVNGTFHATTVSVMADVTADDYLFNSDARLKTEILPLENASEGIACLQGVTYRWRDPNASQALQLGLIAQEVERCFPEVVTTGPDGYKSVSYARLVAPLIENAKEQQQVSELQQRTLAAQQRQLADQAQELTRLKSEQAATNARLARLEALLNAR